MIFGAGRRAGGVKVTVSAEPTAVGEISRHQITARVRRIVSLLTQAGIPAKASRNVRGLLWKKVAYNCALNPLASLLKTHYGSLGEQGWTRRIMEGAIFEVYRVAKRLGIRMHPRTSEGYVRHFYKILLPRTYHHHPSMLQDLRAARKTEIDALNGAIVRLGRKLGVRTPVNGCLTTLIRNEQKACGG